MPQWRREWPQSLTFRLLVSYMLAWLLTVALISAVLWLVFQFQTKERGQHSAERMAHVLADMLVFDAKGRLLRLDWRDELQWLPQTMPHDIAYLVTDSTGQVHLKSPPASGSDGMPQPRLYSHTLQVNHAGSIWTIQASLSERLAALIHLGSERRMGGTALATAGLSILLLGIVLLLTVQRLLRPLRETSAQAAQIGPHQLSQRLDDQNLPSEFKPLVKAFNQALLRLEDGFHNQQRFLENAAHELKTPLALLRGQIELGGAEDTEQLLGDVDHLARQVQQLLVLAEVSERSSYQPEFVHLWPLAQEVMGFLAPLGRRRDVRLDLLFENSSTMVRGDRMALFVLLKNLLENALNFAPVGSTVTLLLRDQGLSVRDHGPGIDPAHLPHVFERFWRNPERRHEGAGLGLAICHEIAVAHGWTLTASPFQPGAEFTLSFSGT
jgi:two-component system, OmpR family, sensor histidine kinase QseC